jgi:ABC-type uncharacterized transport system permease subunit
MPHVLLSIACHAYASAAIAYLAYLVRPWRLFPIAARFLVGSGLVLHAIALVTAFSGQGGMPQGILQGLSVLAFLLLSILLALEIRYRIPVMGALLTPIAVAILVPALVIGEGTNSLPNAFPRPLLPLHISVALLGLAAFGVAAGVALMYLLMDRQMKGKHFGVLFSRLPSLRFLDELNRLLVVWGFVALSVTLITGAFFAGHGFFWAWDSKEIATVVAWGIFAALLTARFFAGWQGRRVAVLTMAGFCLLLISFFTSYNAEQYRGLFH